MKNSISKSLPLRMVGGSQFGRYPKISLEKTFNMIISDDALVNYFGYKNVATISANGKGRDIFSSSRLGKRIVVIDNVVYLVDNKNIPSFIGNLDTFDGDVFIAENNGAQIAICDQSNIYIFNYENNTFQKILTDFTPGYVAFQNGYFISSERDAPKWRLSNPNDGTMWPAGSANVGEFEAKPDNVVACVPVPGKNNLIFIMGRNVTTAWVDTGGTDTSIFPYQLMTQFNIDYGCINAASIGVSDLFIAWLGINEKSGPVILLSEGGEAQQISTDGFNFVFSQLSHPEVCYGFLSKQAGHLIYQLTFSHPEDNISLAYDFTSKQFCNLTDEKMNAHIAKRVILSNNTYYFVSLIDGNIYELSDLYTDLDGQEMPMIRITPYIRLPDSTRYIVNNLSFPIEQGISDEVQQVHFSMTKDGGRSFSSVFKKQLQSLAYRQNRFYMWNLGQASEIAFQFRFYGRQRFVIKDGEVGIYQ